MKNWHRVFKLFSGNPVQRNDDKLAAFLAFLNLSELLPFENFENNHTNWNCVVNCPLKANSKIEKFSYNFLSFKIRWSPAWSWKSKRNTKVKNIDAWLTFASWWWCWRRRRRDLQPMELMICFLSGIVKSKIWRRCYC